jgi:hypothetical protein
VAVTADILYRVRLELGDLEKAFNWSDTGDGSTKVYDLRVKPLDVASLVVTVNNTPIAQPAGYTVQADHGLITFASAPGNNTTIRVSGTHYRYFTDTDLELFINTAVEQHTYNRTDGFGNQMNLAKVPAVEEYPIAILSVIEALWALATDASFDINIFAPDGVTIPRSERYHQLVNMINQRQEQYRTLCSALNIGLWRLELGTLRRVSRTTNKLVPVYMPQEIDDARKPERVYIQNDMLGRSPMPTTAAIYDLVMYQGDSFSIILDFPDTYSITNLVFKAQIRTYPNAPARYAEFTVTVTDPVLKKIQLSLTKQQTAYLPVRAFWDLQATSTVDATFQKTYIKGQVFVTQQVTVD